MLKWISRIAIWFDLVSSRILSQLEDPDTPSNPNQILKKKFYFLTL